MPFSSQQWTDEKISRINSQLVSYFKQESSNLHDACIYPIQTGGKRIRPLFLLATVEALGGKVNADAYTCACALELIHTYSLVHDDLPSMDNDDVRRGKPTVHKVFGDNVAILVGDSLLTKAFEILSDLKSDYLSKIISIMGQAAGSCGMIGGQSLDIGFEGPVDNVQRLQRLHARKTGALIKSAVVMGGVLCSVQPETMEKLEQFGDSIGLAFQLVDDILDTEEDQKENGPPSFVKLKGFSWTKERSTQELNKALHLISDLPNPQSLTHLAKFTVNREY